jgi:mono/diheme cytochrome c family protein
VVVAGLYVWSENKLARTYDIPPSGLSIPTDTASVERGRRWAANVFQCTECHGADLGGQVMFDDFLTGRLVGANLTTGEGGVGGHYTDEDWVRAIRHGVLPNGRAGVAMVSNIFYYLSDADVTAIVAYIKTVPPVDNVLPPTRLGLMGRLYVLQAEAEVLPASGIDHTAPRPPSPAPGVTAEYGQYLSHFRTFCHGENYAGYAAPEPDPAEPMPANLTPAGDLARWTVEDFIRTLRTGTTPEGKRLDPEAMPWRQLGQMSDDELTAIFLFLQTLPAAEPSLPAGP